MMRNWLRNLSLAVVRMAVRHVVMMAILPGLSAGVLIGCESSWAQKQSGVMPEAAAVVGVQDSKAGVTIDNFTFTPPEITVKPGTTVTWVNHDDIPHSVAANDKAFRSRALDTDEFYSFTFSSLGTFDYFCGLHPHMTGKVIVKS
ncbi:hypothetical protein BH10PSE10_BH10PSE10_17450 [soil metagenome]